MKLRMPNRNKRARFNRVSFRRQEARSKREGAYVIALDGRVHITADHKADFVRTLCGRSATGLPSRLGPDVWPKRCPHCRDRRRNMQRGRRQT